MAGAQLTTGCLQNPTRYLTMGEAESVGGIIAGASKGLDQRAALDVAGLDGWALSRQGNCRPG